MLFCYISILSKTKKLIFPKKLYLSLLIQIIFSPFNLENAYETPTSKQVVKKSDIVMINLIDFSSYHSSIFN